MTIKKKAPPAYGIVEDTAKVQMKRGAASDPKDEDNKSSEGQAFTNVSDALQAVDACVSMVRGEVEHLLEFLRPHMPNHLYDEKGVGPSPSLECYYAAGNTNTPTLIELAQLANRLCGLRDRVAYIRSNVCP